MECPNDSVRAMVQGFVARFNGDTEKTARWMRDKLHLGGVKQTRAMIAACMEAK